MKTIDFHHWNPVHFFAETAFEQKLQNFLEEWTNDSPLVRVQSSGSTGVPKIFEVEKTKMQHSARITCNFLRLSTGSTALLCLPLDYISGKMMVVRALERHMKLIVAEPSLNPLESLNSPIDFCAMTPLQAENSLDKLYLIKKLIIGGAAVSEVLKNKIEDILRANKAETVVYETYGMTETLSHIALKELYPKPKTYFHTLEGIEISLDERGCLKIFCPALNDEILQTNDIVDIRADHEFRFLGRMDNVINSGGAKIFPEELEALAKKEVAREVLFIGMPDEVFGQKLMAVVEGHSDQVLKAKISDLDYEHSWQRPKEVRFVDQIPRTPNGKVDRRATLQLLNSLG